jgi:hypothetical protein
MSDALFTVKNVIRPMNVWQFDETQATELPSTDRGNSSQGFLSLPEEVEEAFEDAGFKISVVNSNKWDTDADGKFFRVGSVIEATVFPRYRTGDDVTVVHGQYVGLLPGGELTIIEPENVLP